MSSNALNVRLLAHVVSYNSADTIDHCVRDLLATEGFAPGKLLCEVTDNNSSDDTPALLRKLESERLSVRCLNENTGFCEAHNQAYQRALNCSADYIAFINPDLGLRKDTLAHLVRALESDASAAAATPKLLRADKRLEAVSPPTLDAAGMYLTGSFRHFDRGGGALDQGQFDQPQYVFGGTGALLVLKVDAIEDFLVADRKAEVFDERFFAFREDADLAWRLQLSGWRCRYVPSACAYHVRRVTPERRSQLSDKINAFGVRNRFLLQFGNFNLRDCWSCIPATTWRNLLVLGAVATLERSSLPALKEAFSRLGEMTRRSRLQQGSRRAAPGALRHWFGAAAAAEPALEAGRPGKHIKTVRAVIINYNAGNRLNACVSALEQTARKLQHARHLEVVVLDNASADASAVRLEASYKNNPRVSFNFQERNLGFAGGINKALADVEFDAALILNPDVVMSSPAVEELCEQLSRFDNIGLAAAVLTDPLGEVQSGFTVRRFPSLASVAAESLGLHAVWPSNPWTSRQRCLSAQDWRLQSALRRQISALPYEANQPLVVEQPAAACIMIRREAFLELGGFDEEFWPAWYEDVDFCRRLAESNWRAVICPKARVVHEGGYSLSVIKRSGFVRAWYPNLFRYWKKHHGALSNLGLHIVVRLGIALRILAAPAALLGSSNSDERREIVNTLKANLAMLLHPDSRSAPKHAAHTLGKLSSSVRGLAQRVDRTLGGAPKQNILSKLGDQWLEELPTALRGSGIQLSTNSIELSEHLLLTIIESPGVRRSSAANGAGSLPRPDLRTDIETLSGVIDDSYDFLIAVDVLHQTSNPLRALMNWTRVVKPRGLIYLTLPKTTDADIDTTLEHLIADYLRPSSERDLEHYIEYASGELGLIGQEAITKAGNLQASAERVVMHHLSLPTLRSLIDWAAKHVAPMEMAQDVITTRESGRSHWLIRAL